MAQYIWMGPVFLHSIKKQDLDRATLFSNFTQDELREGLISNFSPDIYDFIETDEEYIFQMKKSITAKDFLDLYDGFNKINWNSPNDLTDIEAQREKLSKMKTLEDVENFVEEHGSNTIKFWEMKFPNQWHTWVYKVNGKLIFPNTGIWGVAFTLGYRPVIAESDSESFVVFTDLLRSKLQPLKLADSMLVTVSI